MVMHSSKRMTLDDLRRAMGTKIRNGLELTYLGSTRLTILKQSRMEMNMFKSRIGVRLDFCLFVMIQNYLLLTCKVTGARRGAQRKKPSKPLWQVESRRERLDDRAASPVPSLCLGSQCCPAAHSKRPDIPAKRPTPVSLSGVSAIAIAAGTFHTCAISTGGGVKCWGNNEGGQLGIGYQNNYQNNPVDVPGTADD
jgi:hypothetical protein